MSTRKWFKSLVIALMLGLSACSAEQEVVGITREELLGTWEVQSVFASGQRIDVPAQWWDHDCGGAVATYAFRLDGGFDGWILCDSFWGRPYRFDGTWLWLEGLVVEGGKEVFEPPEAITVKDALMAVFFYGAEVVDISEGGDTMTWMVAEYYEILLTNGGAGLGMTGS